MLSSRSWPCLTGVVSWSAGLLSIGLCYLPPGASLAYAQQTPRVGDQRAVLLEQAEAARYRRQWAECLQLLRAAGRMRMSPSVRSAIAGALFELHNYSESAREADLCLLEATRDSRLTDYTRSSIHQVCMDIKTRALQRVTHQNEEASQPRRQPQEAVSAREPQDPVLGFDAGLGVGFAFLDGFYPYAEDRQIPGDILTRNCGERHCPRPVPSGVYGTEFLSLRLHVYFGGRYSVGLGARIQTSSADWCVDKTGISCNISNSFANLLVFSQFRVLLGASGWRRTGSQWIPNVGFGGGQIEPQVDGNGTHPGAHVYSGPYNFNLGMEWRYVFSPGTYLSIGGSAHMMYTPRRDRESVYLFNLDSFASFGYML